MPHDLGRAVRALREARGISKQELERRAKVSRGYVSRLESGARGTSITAEMVAALARGLDVDPSALQGTSGHGTTTPTMTDAPPSGTYHDPCPNRTRAAELAIEDQIPPWVIARVMSMEPDPGRSVLSWAREMTRIVEQRGRQTESGEHRRVEPAEKP